MTKRRTTPFDDLAISIFLPLNNPRAGTQTVGRYANLIRSQWYDQIALERLQRRKLKRLLDHARANVPFYERYDPWDGSEEGTLRDRLSALPILTKDKIRQRPTAMLQTTGIPRGCIRRTTGGTTGEPIKVCFDRHHLAMVEAASWRGKSWIGIRPWTRGVNVNAFGRGSWYGRLRMRLTNKWLLDVFGRTSAEQQRIAKKLIHFRPKYLEGFVSQTLGLGRACLDAGVEIQQILTTGEMLYEYQRRELEKLYGANVSDYYGCNEVGAMAFGCEMGRKHVTDEHVIIEVVDEERQPVWDKPGRILLTDLDNYLTPFIRYEVGDKGMLTAESCPCGRRLTVLKSLDGRTQDAIRNGAGDQLNALFFAGRFRDLKAIHRIQLIQRTITEIDLLYEGTAAGIDAEIDAIVGEICDRLGAQTVVTPRQVENLVYTGRGKRRLIVSLDEKSIPKDAHPAEQESQVNRN